MSEPATDENLQASEPRSNRLLTIPNVLCAIRLVGSPFLIVLAALDRHGAFVGLFLAMAFTDWIDGKLAILLDQRSVFGARLDSWADATLYGCLLIGGVLLRHEELAQESVWIGAAVGSYVISTLAGFWKFNRWPSYHTRAAKTSWFLITVGAVSLLMNWSIWPLRIAMMSVTLTNVEATIITLIASKWHADVPSLYHAWKLEKGASPSQT